MRDLCLEAEAVQEVRLACIKKRRKKKSSQSEEGGVSPGALYYRAYVGELLLAHVPASWAPPPKAQQQQPVTSILPLLRCARLELRQACWTAAEEEEEGMVRGLLQWEWEPISLPTATMGRGSGPPAAEEQQEGGGAASMMLERAGVRCVDVLMRRTTTTPLEEEGGLVWLGRSLTDSFWVQHQHQHAPLQASPLMVLVVQPTDLWGNSLPLHLCPTLTISPTPPNTNTTTALLSQEDQPHGKQQQ